MSCWGIKSLSKMASVIGIPQFADECTAKQTRIYYAKILIEVKVIKSLPEEMILEDPLGSKFQHKVIYE